MTPKYKAKELLLKHWEVIYKSDTCFSNDGLCNNPIDCQHSWYKCKEWLSYSKSLTKITVEEILSTLSPYSGDNNTRKYWMEVIQEINNLE